ncbi:zinc-binding dehydrogenase [Massilia sp. TWR1-2-2]|uniref:zinc-binding dehydrogenase n=1 Tax=Massilia sp. TWR1-2-2 TaxID=2804584 RepID=UPI003CEEFED3
MGGIAPWTAPPAWERLLIRGGTTSIGFAAAAIARAHGAQVGATSRQSSSAALIRASGADKVLELVGTATLADSLAAVREPGLVCMAGMVGDRWSFAEIAPMDVIPTGVSLTTYSGGVADFLAMPLQELIDRVADGRLPVAAARVFRLDGIVEAHRLMESNQAGGKIVVLC